MAAIAQFSTLKFEISASDALLFEKLKISTECSIEEQVSDSQEYVSAKNGKAAQITFSILLHAALGADVQKMAATLHNMAQRSEESYFYMNGAKVFPFRMMMTKAETEEIAISPGGKWVSAKINVTMKQSSSQWIFGDEQASQAGNQNSGGNSYHSSAGTATAQKATVKTVSPTPKPSDSILLLQNQSITALKNAQDSVAKKAVSAVMNLISTAKTSTAAVLSSLRTNTTKVKTVSTRKPR